MKFYLRCIIFQVRVTRPTDLKDPEFFRTQDCLPECGCKKIKFNTLKKLKNAKWKDLRDEAFKHLKVRTGSTVDFRAMLKDHYNLLHGLDLEPTSR